MNKLTKIQESVLDALIRHKGWYEGCGWIWGCRSRTVKVLDSLVNKGYAVKIDNKYIAIN